MKNNKAGLNEIENNLCENIKKYAEEKKLKASEVAEYLGVSKQTIYHYYRKLMVPPVFTIYRLSILFNVSLYDLLGVPEPKKRSKKK